MENNTTYAKLVSSIRSMFKMINSDDLITNRVIVAEIQSANKKLCLQQLQKRSGWNSPNLFTILDCIQMEETSQYDCCGGTSPCKIAKSKIRIPRIVDCNNNLVVQGVWSIDKQVKFNEIGNYDRYNNILKIYPKKSNEKFFWIQDNYLYINDSLVEVVSLSAFFEDIIDINEFSCNNNTICPPNPLDAEFKTLPKLEDDIKKMVRDSILKDYKQSKDDKTVDNNDESK